jgi:hypothetical protein
MKVIYLELKQFYLNIRIKTNGGYKMARLKIDGYGQLELNNVAFRRDGRIEAQCRLDETDFAEVPAENGMLLAVDNVTRTIKFAKDGSLPIALNYTTEHMYDERKVGLKDFKLGIEDGFYPRLGYLAIGDKFTTNCIDTEMELDALKAATTVEALQGTPLYGGISATGAIAVSTTEPTVGPVLLAVQGTTMPDGQFAIKFQVKKA